MRAVGGEKGLDLGFVLNFGTNLMKEGIERVVNGFAEENLCVSASLRETEIISETNRAANTAPPHR